MKRLIAASAAAVLLAYALVVLAGCGGGGGSEGGLTEAERALDTAMRAAVGGDLEPFLELIPEDMRAQYKEIIGQSVGNKTGGSVIEAHYRTEQGKDADHVTVYGWWTIEYVDESGNRVTEAMSEEEANPLPMVKKDGRWYLDVYGEGLVEE